MSKNPETKFMHTCKCGEKTQCLNEAKKSKGTSTITTNSKLVGRSVRNSMSLTVNLFSWSKVKFCPSNAIGIKVWS